LARELLSEVYRAPDLAAACRRLIVFFQHCADAEVPELTRLARTIDRWRDEVLAFHTTGGASNGPTEAVNLLVEKIRCRRSQNPPVVRGGRSGNAALGVHVIHRVGGAGERRGIHQSGSLSR
jgi:hypothetical protein